MRLLLFQPYRTSISCHLLWVVDMAVKQTGLIPRLHFGGLRIIFISDNPNSVEYKGGSNEARYLCCEWETVATSMHCQQKSRGKFPASEIVLFMLKAPEAWTNSFTIGSFFFSHNPVCKDMRFFCWIWFTFAGFLTVEAAKLLAMSVTVSPRFANLANLNTCSGDESVYRIGRANERNPWTCNERERKAMTNTLFRVFWRNWMRLPWWMFECNCTTFVEILTLNENYWKS